MSANKLTKMQVRNEMPATRCEICHQADRFDPITNFCARCSNISRLNIYFDKQFKLEYPDIDIEQKSREISLGMISGLIFNWAVMMPIVKIYFDPEVPIVTLALLTSVPFSVFGLIISIVNSAYLINIPDKQLSIPQAVRHHWLICNLRSFIVGVLTIVALLPFYGFLILIADGSVPVSFNLLYYIMAIMIVIGVSGSLISTLNAFLLIRDKIRQSR